MRKFNFRLRQEGCNLTSDSAFAAITILTLASFSPLLKQFIPDLNELQEETIRQISRWAFPGSSIESMLSITRVLILKRKMTPETTDSTFVP